jgi:hypothetical protein
MVQRNAVKKIVILGAIVAATIFFVLVPKAAIMFGGFLTALLGIIFPVITLLPVSTILLLTFLGFGAIVVWAIHKRDLKPVIFPGSLLLLPALVATTLMVFIPTFEWHFTFTLFLPLSAVMLSIFVGLAAIVVFPSYRQDMGQVLKLIGFTSGAIVLSIFFQLVLFFLWALALRFVPGGTNFVTGLVIVYLYWPGKKRGLFLRVFGAVLVLELALLLTIKLVT